MASTPTWIKGTDANLSNYKILAAPGATIVGVKALDVGQGNANPIMDTTAGGVSFYFDAGGGCYWNARTYPADDVDFKLADRPVIVLSHWDGDHWYGGGVRHRDQGLQCRWLAPRQEVSPLHQKLAAELKGKLRLWPKGRTDPLQVSTANGYVQIDKCEDDGRNKRNNSGLALTVVKEDAADPFEDQKILLTGDAGFEFVPSLEPDPDKLLPGRWRGLFATHHGSATHLHNIPTAAEGAKIVYSFGPGNTYGHPKQEAIDAYEAEGWEDGEDGVVREDTATTGAAPDHAGDCDIDFA